MHQLTTVSCLPSSQLDKLLLLFIHLPLHLAFHLPLHQDLLPSLQLLNMVDIYLTLHLHHRTFFPLCSCSTRWTFLPCSPVLLWPGHHPAK